MELITLILIALNALLDVFLSVGVGVLISVTKFGSKNFKKELAAVAFNVFLPCLMFNSIVVALDLSKSKVLLQKFFVAFFYGVFIEIIGYVVGFFCFPTAIFGPVMSRISIFVVTFGNTTTLPLMFVNVICATSGLFQMDSSATKEQNRAQALLLGTTYISAFFSSFAIVFWTIGYVYYSDPTPKQKVVPPKKEPLELRASQINELDQDLGKEKGQVQLTPEIGSPILPVYKDENMLLNDNEEKSPIPEEENDEENENEEEKNSILGGPRKGKFDWTAPGGKYSGKYEIYEIYQFITKAKTVWGKISATYTFLKKMYYKLALNNVITPPLISLVLGFICAGINPIRSILVVTPPPGIQAMMHVFEQTGSMYAKCALIVLGMSLYDSFFTPVPKKKSTAFMELSLYKKIRFIINKGHKSFFPHTNIGLVLMTVFLRQIAVPIIVLFFVIGYFYLGIKFTPADDAIGIWNSVLRILLSIVPSNDPVLIFVLVLSCCTPTGTAATMMAILKGFGEAQLGEILLYQYLLSPPILVAFTSLALYVSCSITEKCY